MKICLSSKQTKEYLDQADEIKVAYNDRNSIFELIEKYPHNTIILDCMTEKDLDWKEIERYKILARDNFIVCVKNINELRQAHSCGVRRYFGYPISSFWELHSILTFDVEYVILDMELFFKMPKVKNLGAKIRAIPNLAYNDGFPHENGIPGTWIRPEDLMTVYEDYIDAIEFEDCDDIQKEQALFRVYWKEHKWDSRLDLLITNLNHPAINRFLTEDFSVSRTTCGQRCLSGGVCKLCYRAMDLADANKVEALREKLK